MTLNNVFALVSNNSWLEVDVNGVSYKEDKREISLMLERDGIDVYSVYVVELDVRGYDCALYIEGVIDPYYVKK